MVLPIDKVFSLIDFLGVFAAALGGAIAAVRDTRYKYDLVGVTGLAFAAALRGGIIRDLILQHGPPLAFSNSRYLLLALAGAAGGRLFPNPAVKYPDPAIPFFAPPALSLFSLPPPTLTI